MGFLNIKIGPLVKKLWPCKVRLSGLEEEKIGFFQTNSFKLSTVKCRSSNSHNSEQKT